MTKAVAGCTLEQNSVLQRALAGSTFENDVLNAISDAQGLATEIFHRWSEQEAVVLTRRIERALNFVQRLNAD